MKSIDAYARPPTIEQMAGTTSPSLPQKQESEPESTQKQVAQEVKTSRQEGFTKADQKDSGQPHTETKKVPRFWKVLMVLAAMSYLIPEAIFNAQLVNVSGRGVIDGDSLRHIELFGRMISGIGVSLLVCDAIGSRFVKSGASALGVVGLIFLLCWPTVFFGQKILVDKFIINPSTAEDRQHAYLSQLIRSALANNAIGIEGIAYDPDHAFNPQEMTFMALFGGMVYADDRLATVFEDKGKTFIAEMVKKDAYRNFEQHWLEYTQLYERLADEYETYANGSRQYNRVLESISDKQITYWDDVERQIDNGWTNYREAVDNHKRRARSNAESYGPKIFDYFERRNKCRSDSCVSRLDKRYYDEIGKLGLGRINPPYWYKKVPVSTAENVAGTLGAALGTMGLSLIAQGADLATGGDGGFKDSKNVVTNDIDHYESKINALDEFEQKFVNATGYPTTIDSKTEFRRHPFTARKALKTLAAKGLLMPDGWSLSDKATFNAKVRSKVTAQAQSEWDAKVAERGLNIPPNIPWKKFQVLPEVQERIKAEMGSLYVKPTYADWNKKTFKDRIVDPAINREAGDIIRTLEANQSSYGNGGENEEVGKEMLRAIVIPPISMGLSLFLVILTIMKMPGKVFGLFHDKDRSVASFPLRLSIGGTRLALILALPLFLWSPVYTAEGSTVHYFLGKTAESGGVMTKHFLNWVLHAQPVLHPVGDTFESALGLYKASEATVNTLNTLDGRVIGGA